MPANDNAFKLLVQYAPQQFVDRFFPGAVYVGTLPTELPREPLRADALLRVRYPAENGEDYALHIEVQTGSDATMPLRLCTYALLAMARDHVKVISRVIYLEKCATPSTPWRVAGPDGTIIEYHFQVIKLWEESVDDWLASGQVGLLPFVPFLKGATVASLDQVIAELEAIVEPVQRSSSLYYTIAFAKRTFGPDVINDYLRRNEMLDTFLRESPFYQEILAEGEKTGELRGLRESVIALVRQRFSAIVQEAEARLAHIDEPEQLRELVVQVATAPDEAAVRQALGMSATA